MGLASRDESSGPLLVEYLYDQGAIPEKQFGILLSPVYNKDSMLTFGGYEKDGGEMYDARKYQMTSNRIAGSFHWQLKLNKMGFGGRTFTPSQRFALTDTGTSLIIMPDEDW